MGAFPDRSSSDSALIVTDINDLNQGVSTYEATRDYKVDRIVESVGLLYKSLVTPNIGNTPASSPSEWEVFSSGGGGVTSFNFTLSGNSIVGEDQIEFMIPSAITVSNVFIKVDTAPTGDDMEVDINKNGTTIFTTQSGRPIITASGTSDTSDTPDITAFAQNDILGISIDQVGSTIGGGDNLYIRVNF